LRIFLDGGFAFEDAAGNGPAAAVFCHIITVAEKSVAASWSRRLRDEAVVSPTGDRDGPWRIGKR